MVSNQQVSRTSVLRFVILWLVLSILFFGISFFIYLFIQMSRGDINRDGKIDGTDISIIESNAFNGAGESTFVQLSAPTASTSSPRRTVHAPIILTN